MSFAALQVAAYEKQYRREQKQMIRAVPTDNNMNRSRTTSSASEKSVPPSKVMIKVSGT